MLASLLEKPGEIVTKEELQDRVWKDNTFIDFDRSLATAIKKVRQALGDSATRPQYIETVAKRGYRFICLPSASGADNWNPHGQCFTNHQRSPLLFRREYEHVGVSQLPRFSNPAIS